jgi:hypothetical protein
MSHAYHDEPASRWSTASYGEPATPSPDEISSLGEHLNHCRLGSWLLALECVAQDLQVFVAAHLFTSVALAFALIALIGLTLGSAT